MPDLDAADRGCRPRARECGRALHGGFGEWWAGRSDRAAGPVNDPPPTARELAEERDYWKSSFELLMKRRVQGMIERNRALAAWGSAAVEQIRLMGQIARLERALRDIAAVSGDPQIVSRVREELDGGAEE